MMCHSVTTACRSYFLEDKARNVGKTFTAMHGTMRDMADKENVNMKIISIFAEELSRGDAITLDLVKKKSDQLAEIPLSDKKVRDRLRYVKAKEGIDKGMMLIPENDHHESIHPATSTSDIPVDKGNQIVLEIPDSNKNTRDHDIIPDDTSEANMSEYSDECG